MLEELLNLPEIIILKVENIANEIHIYSESALKVGFCPQGSEKIDVVKSYRERVIRDLPISGRKVYIHLKVRQFYCAEHHEYFYQSFSFVDSNAVFTNRYKENIYNSCKGVDIQYIANKEELSWDTVNDIFKNYSQEEIEKKNG